MTMKSSKCDSAHWRFTCISGSCIEAFRPRFQCPTLACNIFPTPSDRSPDKRIGSREKWTLLLTLIFGASLWLTETETSPCLDDFLHGSSLSMCLVSENVSLDLLVLPERSSLNWTVYG